MIRVFVVYEEEPDASGMRSTPSCAGACRA